MDAEGDVSNVVSQVGQGSDGDPYLAQVGQDSNEDRYLAQVGQDSNRDRYLAQVGQESDEELWDGATGVEDDAHDKLLGDDPPQADGPGRVLKQRCTFYVEPLLFTFALSQFPVLILSSQYIYKRQWERIDVNHTFNYSFNTNTNHCQTDQDDPLSQLRAKVQSASSYFSLQTTLVAILPAILTSMFLGAYSDRVGRKYAILPPIFGQTFMSLLYVLVIYFNLPIEVLFVGSFVYGCCGYYVTLLLGCLAYVADSTTTERRSFRIVVVELCMFAPTILSSAGSGFWLKAMGFLWPFVTVLCFNIAIGVYAVFVLPETIRRDPTAKLLNVDHLKQAATVSLVDDGSNRRWKIQVLLVALFLCLVPGMAFGIDTLYEMNAPLCWGPVSIGLLSAITIAVGVVGSAVSAKLFGFCLSDAWIAFTAGNFSIMSNIFKSFVKNSTMMLATPVFSGCSVLFTPTVRAMLSKIVKPEEYGAVFGAVAVAELLCSLVGSSIFNPIYAATNSNYRGAVFLVMAAFYAVGVLLMLIFALKTRKSVKEKVLDVPGIDP